MSTSQSAVKLILLVIWRCRTVGDTRRDIEDDGSECKEELLGGYDSRSLESLPEDVLLLIRHWVIYDHLGFVGCCKAGEGAVLKYIFESSSLSAKIRVDQCLKDEGLLAAASHGHVDVVSLLAKELGANVHVNDDRPLRKASESQRWDVVRCLVGCGADVNADDDLALRWASAYGRLDVVRILVEKGADVHSCRDIPLRRAARNGHLKCVQYLMDNGADVSARDHGALRWAAGKGQLEVVEYLLDRGADVNAFGGDAISQAVTHGHVTTALALAQGG